MSIAGLYVVRRALVAVFLALLAALGHACFYYSILRVGLQCCIHPHGLDIWLLANEEFEEEMLDALFGKLGLQWPLAPSFIAEAASSGIG